MRRDPDFAIEQYGKMKSENTKLFQKTKQYEAITEIADRAGGAEVARGLLEEFAAIHTHPDVRRVREHFRVHQTVPTASAPQPDDNLEDEYQDPQAVKINALENELAMIRTKQSRTEGEIGKQNVIASLKVLREKYPEGFEEYVLPEITKWMENQSRTPQGRELLATISLDQLETISARAMLPHFDELAEKRHLRRLEEKKRLSTGGSASTLTNGREPAAQSRGRVGALEGLADFKRQEGLR